MIDLSYLVRIGLKLTRLDRLTRTRPCRAESRVTLRWLCNDVVCLFFCTNFVKVCPLSTSLLIGLFLAFLPTIISVLLISVVVGWRAYVLRCLQKLLTATRARTSTIVFDWGYRRRWIAFIQHSAFIRIWGSQVYHRDSVEILSRGELLLRLWWRARLKHLCLLISAVAER